MNATLSNALATYLAEIDRVTDTPVSPFGYGTDLSCTSDLAVDFGDVDPFSTRAIAEALVRRLDCPRGQLPDDPDYGIDLKGALNKAATRQSLLALSGQIGSELEKDDRVHSATAVVTLSSDGRTLTVNLRIAPITSDGTFTMTLAVTSAEVLMQELNAA